MMKIYEWDGSNLAIHTITGETSGQYSVTGGWRRKINKSIISSDLVDGKFYYGETLSLNPVDIKIAMRSHLQRAKDNVNALNSTIIQAEKDLGL